MDLVCKSLHVARDHARPIPQACQELVLRKQMERIIVSLRNSEDLPSEEFYWRRRITDILKIRIKTPDARRCLKEIGQSRAPPVSIETRRPDLPEDTLTMIWTRNFGEIRAILSGHVDAFDKHWNLVLSDVDEVYLKPKKEKTPYLDRKVGDDVPELPRKVKRPKTTEEAAAAKKPKKNIKMKGRKYYQRHFKQLFNRGDNIKMVAVLE